MNTFPQDYFNGETRDGFYIEEKMKRAWAAQLEVLDEIKRVCAITDTRFFADWGTLLGAVRHHGFIPWDDDMDICMLRPDYMRFLDAAPQYLSEFFELKSLYNDPTHDIVKARVITGRHINFDRNYLERFHGCPYVVGIDIFPIDYIPRDKNMFDEYLRCLKLTLQSASSIPQEPPYGEDVRKLLSSLENTFSTSFNPENRPFHEIKRLFDELSARYSPDDADEVCSMLHQACDCSYYHIPKEAYQDSIDMPFENTTIPVPVGYDAILKVKYGDGYMTPLRVNSSHEYPFYKKQEQSLKEVIEKEFNTTLSDDDFNALLRAKLNLS